MVIVIDGPAASGKSSTAKVIAGKLGLIYIDSGAIYRIATMLYNSSSSEEEFFENFDRAQIQFDYKDGKTTVFVDGKDVSQQIRTREVDENVSHVATNPRVRNVVNAFLRNYTRNGSFIGDGRDLGTEVFPEADVKIFMVASLKARALRRFKEQPDGATLQEIEDNLAQRDEIDSNRSIAPLKKASDATVVDTSECSFDEQVSKIIDVIKAKVKTEN